MNYDAVNLYCRKQVDGRQGGIGGARRLGVKEGEVEFLHLFLILSCVLCNSLKALLSCH